MYVSATVTGGTFEVADQAAQRVLDAGVVLVAAAGNQSGNACDRSPARVPGVVAVASMGEDDRPALSSNTGPCVDLWAPGRDIVAAGLPDPTSITTKSGTSMATPMVAGVMAIYFSAGGTLANLLADAEYVEALAGEETTGRLLSLSRLNRGESQMPTLAPTADISTFAPSRVPTVSPSYVATTTVPTTFPTFAPAPIPSTFPTLQPSGGPTPLPSFIPTPIPSTFPTLLPSGEPTEAPTSVPSWLPTTLARSLEPSEQPSLDPSAWPSGSPSQNLTGSNQPSTSFDPSMWPSQPLTINPSLSPSSLSAVPTSRRAGGQGLVETMSPTATPVTRLSRTEAPSISVEDGRDQSLTSAASNCQAILWFPFGLGFLLAGVFL
jgi:hypothetical protein